MEKLTKEQKMDMLSKAIDEGFEIKIVRHWVESLEEMNESLDLFPGLPVQFRGSKEKETAWVNINPKSHGDDDNFEVVIFLK